MVHMPGGKSKVVYASTSGFHAVDMDTGVVQNIYIPAAAVSAVNTFVWCMYSVCNHYCLLQARGPILPHAIIPLPSKPSELLLCHNSKRKRKEIGQNTCRIGEYNNYCIFVCLDEGVYVDSEGRSTKDTRLQWGEEPSSVGKYHMYSGEHVYV